MIPLSYVDMCICFISSVGSSAACAIDETEQGIYVCACEAVNSLSSMMNEEQVLLITSKALYRFRRNEYAQPLVCPFVASSFHRICRLATLK
jgi:hypothetical protein